jgi:uncharacterized membrane protein YjgN (DUF898 family)
MNTVKTQGMAIALKETVVNIGLAASEYAVLWPILLIIAALAILAVAVVAGFAIFNALVETNAEKANKAA